MLYYLALGLGGLLAILFLRFTRRKLYQLSEDSVSVLNVILSSEEDEVKLKQMQAGTSRLVISLLLSIGLLATAVILAYLPVYFLELLASELPSDKSALWEIVAVSIGASVPFFVPLPRGASNYSELSILLHRLILNNYTIALKLFSREVKGIHKQGLDTRNDFVIISGLARAGTTSIMNKLVEVPGFSSLNYGNMPFLLSPKLWARVYKP